MTCKNSPQLRFFKIGWVENTFFFNFTYCPRCVNTHVHICDLFKSKCPSPRQDSWFETFPFMGLCPRPKKIQIRNNFRVRVHDLENFNVSVRVRMDCWFHWKFPWLKLSEELPAIRMEFVNVGWSFFISFC